MIFGMKETLLLCVDSLGFWTKVIHSMIIIDYAKQFHIQIGAKVGMAAQFETDTSLSPFLLDDLGCSGSESNLLDCLPQHNCINNQFGQTESATVSCLRKGNDA